MKTPANRICRAAAPARSGGMTLLDVLLAIVIFVIGMLALASLQGNLTRSSSDANARTVGTNIAEELIERFRTFEQLESETGVVAYQDVVDQTLSFDRAGVSYTVDVDVTDYWFMPDRVSVTDDTNDLPSNQDTTISDFKWVEFDIAWTGGEFQVNEGSTTSGRLGSGTFTVAGIVPSTPQLGSAKVAEEDDGALGTPPVDYTPGQLPDIVPITLGDDKFKESTTPEPIVRRRDELVETWFDVITYSNPNDSDAIFLRREEFVAISCQCTLRASSGSEDGRMPTVWTGVEYKEGVLVAKQYGESASNQQSQYCDICCRDHHDTASNSDTAFRPWDPNGVHPHYTRNRFGNYVQANVGDTYLEACRLVRKDGFFRVAQDFLMQAQISMPEDYLTVPANAADYSSYVVSAIEDHFDNGTSPLADHSLTFDGYDEAFPAQLPSINPVSDTMQLVSRSIYADEVSSELSTELANCFPTRGVDCMLPEGVNKLEVLPFFDVQVTKLTRWSETQPDNPINVISEEFANNGYDRGLAELAGSQLGTSTVHAKMERSNVGLIDTLPITEDPTPVYSEVDLYMQAGASTEPPPPGSSILSGTISNAGGTSDAGVAVITGSDGISCSKPTPGTFQCVAGPLVTSGTITVSNYYKNAATPLIVCSTNAAALTYLSHDSGTSAANAYTTFTIVDLTATDAALVIDRYPCS